MRSLASVPAAILGTALAAGLAGHAAAASDDERFVVIKAGTVVTVDGEAIPRGEIVIVDGTIRLVGKGLDYPADATIIDARDETVMPGWVHPTTRHDMPLHRRTGVNGDIVVAGETMLSEVDLSPLAEAGVTAVGAYPSGTGIPGVASVFRTMPPVGLDEDDDRSQVLRDESYLRIVMRGAGGEKDRLAGAFRKAKAEIEKVEKARAEFEKKKAEAEAKAKAEAGDKKDGDKDGEKDGEKKDEEAATFKPPATDPGHAPIIAWIEGDLAVRPLIELSGPSDVLHLMEVLDGQKDLSTANLMLISGFGSDYGPVIDRLAEGDAIVLTTLDLGRLPQTSTVANLPAALVGAGVELALTPETPSTGGGGFRGRGRRGGGGPTPSASVQRGNAAGAIATMRSELAMLVKHGLDRDAALRAITINPARLLGVDDRIGSIATGKDADLVFLDGDAMDPLSEVTRVMILGEIVWEADK